MTRWALIGVLLLLLTGASTAAMRSQQPRTLVSVHGAIYAFAQDGDRVAWIASDGRVRVRSLSTKRTWVVGTVPYKDRVSSATLALARTRALWSFDAGGNSTEFPVVMGAPGHAPVEIAHLGGGLRGMGDGHDLVGLAGDGTTLAYGWVAETCPGQPFGCNVFDAPLVLGGGGASIASWTPPLRAFSPPVIAGVPPPALFAAAQGRLAVAPARPSEPPSSWVPRVIEDGVVEVHDLAGDTLLRVSMPGLVRDVALARSSLAVLLELPDGAKVVLRFVVPNEHFVASAFVPAAASDVATGSGGTTFGAGRDVYVLGSERARLVARAAARPIGLSIEGRRIAWAENVRGNGRIRTLTAP